MALIKITSFSKAKNNGSGGGGGNSSSSKGFATTIKKDLDLHYLWGQPFNGLQDVNGNMDVEGDINVTGNINVENKIISTSIQTNSIDAEIGNIDTLDTVNSNALHLYAAEGNIENLISTNSEIQNLNVDVLNAKQAHFWELVIDKMRSTNGAFILSPANAKIEKVVEDTTNGKFNLMWRTTDINNGKAITNDFEVNDQIICQSFNQADFNNKYDVGNKYYWAKVIDKGTTTAYDELMEITCDWHYITVGGTQVNWDGVLTPEVGDEICVLGNTTDADRQNAIILSSTNSAFLDEDLEAPSIAQYKGIKTFHLKPYRLNCLSGSENTFYGNFNVIVGDSTSDVKDLINDAKSNIASIQTDSLVTFIMADSESKISSIDAATGLVKKIEVYMGNDVIPTSEIQSSSYVQWRNHKFYPIASDDEQIPTVMIREGIDIKNFTVNPNNITINWKYQGQLPTPQEPTSNPETLAENTECIIYINFIHNGTTYEKMFTVPATVISTEKGTDAEFDKLIVDSFKAVVTIEDKLQISGSAYIQHIKGNTITRQDNLNDYVVDAVSNAGDKITFNKSSYFYYSNDNYISNYSSQELSQKYYTVRLFKNTTKIDELTFAVTFDSGAIFQVKADAINSAVKQSKTYTDGQITTVNTNISQIQQTADAISSRVTHIENDYVTHSELTQTADNIQLNVYNELNEKTGIDVSNGKITLNAENTTIVGNLNITDTENGLTVFDSDGVPRINLQPKQIRDITEDIYDAIIPYKYRFTNESAASWYATSESYALTLTKGDTIDIKRIQVVMSAKNTANNTIFPYDGSSDGIVSGTLQVTKPDNTTQTFYLTLNGQGDGLFIQSQKITLNAKSTGSYTFKYTMYAQTNYPTGYNQLYAYISCIYEPAQVRQTYIGTDGLFAHTGASKQVIFDEETTLLQFGANGVRWTEKLQNNNVVGGNRAMDVAVGYNSINPTKILWLPFYNYIPIFNPSIWTNGNIINTGHTSKYYYTINVQKDRGICVLDYPPFNESGVKQDAWILLPSEVMDDGNGSVGYYLPVGYQLTIINHTFITSDKCNLYVSGNATQKNQVVIIDSNRNTNYYANLSGSQSSDTYIYMGKYYNSETGINTMYWQSMHDTQ